MPKKSAPNFESVRQTGLQRLKKLQKKNGGFSSYSWAAQSSSPAPLQLASIFSSALILDALQELPKNNLQQDISKKATAFLLTQKSSSWTFNYWDRHSPEFTKLPYPDDWDDTACSLAALSKAEPKPIDAQVLAKTVKLLTATEVKVGGPYRTWIVNDSATAIWQDTDPVVNSNIAYFLSLHQVTLPNLVSQIEQQIQQKSFTSPYYPTPYPFFYFTSRWYQGALLPQLIKEIKSQQTKNGDWGNALNTALVLSAFCRWQVPIGELQPIFNSLFSTSTKWQAAPFYTGVNPSHDHQFLAGSEALTIALCLEAGQLYQQRLELETKTTTNEKMTETFHTEIVTQTRELFIPDSGLATEFEVWLKKVTQTDPHHQITLLPLLFAKTLQFPATKLNSVFYQKLGMANLLGWIAYTIYDNFLDNEAQAHQLPIANVCLRHLTQIFGEVLPPETGFAPYFHHVMDQLESANLWEVTQARLQQEGSTWLVTKKLPDYPDYQQLANKSLAHALGPIAILLAHGLTLADPNVQKVWQFFTHYLIVRQLNDDLHDWKADLLRGQVNVVSSHLLKKAQLSSITPAQIDHLEKDFWLREITHFCQAIEEHVQLGQMALDQSSVFTTIKPWQNLLHKYLRASQTALSQRDQTLSFWHSYQAQH